MKRTLAIIFTSALLLLCSALYLFAAEEPNIVGSWHGTLQVGADTLHVVFHIARGADGLLSGTLHSPDQGPMSMPVSKITFTGGTLVLTLATIGGSYQAKLAADGNSLSGRWVQNGMSLPLTLTRGDGPALSRPQEPKKPYPYREEEVSFQNAAAHITLAGTFTAPNAAVRYPVALLIAGSGPHDRDENVAGHRPFLVLADYLTRHGIAVLRVDKRGVGHSGGDEAQATSEDFAGDTQAGVAYLKTRPEVNPRQIGLIGHSEGGLIAPIVATRNKDVAFIVLLAGPGVTGEQILLSQGELIKRAMGASQGDIDREHRMQLALFSIIKNEKDDEKAEKQARQYLNDALDQLSAQELQGLGNREQREKFINSQLTVLLSPWMRYYLTYDPRTALRKVTVPVLALNGEKDTQVAAEENLAAIKQALQAGGNTDVTTRELPGLNHLFQTCTTGSPLEYAKIEETFAPAALEILASWILDHCPDGKR